MRTILVSLALIVTMHPSIAATWHFVTFSDNGAYFFIDVESIQVNKNETEAWIQVINVDEKTAATKNSSKSLNQFDCREKSYRYITASFYAADGKFIYTDDVPSRNARTVPETVGDTLLKTVCKNEFSGDTPVANPRVWAENYTKDSAATKKLVDEWIGKTPKKDSTK
ncbi:surface-adhesin E family protein [Comamonas sp.]|uniref:surface-adhesin E family protein n=1 Tax=Comamonas sp. TaxID=34028 RepID=UPI0028996BF4|nr:surface-adhesin E family protein [Comamonas sp.]